MAVHFLDSSALVKRYISEIGSAWILELFNPVFNNEVFVAAISGVEIVAAVTRRARGGSISATDAKAVCSQVKSDLQTEYQIIEIADSIIDAGMKFAETHGLRGYDAIQLAAGCAVNELCIANNLPSIIFVSADKELNVAALSEGLVVENPNDRP
ncbi:type II toxin-antitoxin system VapC family toxin [Scytonema millei]|uniref:Type II toxin-antitoxin system VapC family toxin n=1 Tax=Scytonema millei VB511283 TaxID=1245923 RepID=A0A9X5E2J1_9CYAN|nr:type II toxin-antitoxin system VapC family toxin [Scytonema millei]NHC33588.1 type II toxin-antitoxin system VapC family toxin [Scytonema millei VB511283]